MGDTSDHIISGALRWNVYWTTSPIRDIKKRELHDTVHSRVSWWRPHHHQQMYSTCPAICICKGGSAFCPKRAAAVGWDGRYILRVCRHCHRGRYMVGPCERVWSCRSADLAFSIRIDSALAGLGRTAR